MHAVGPAQNKMLRMIAGPAHSVGRHI